MFDIILSYKENFKEKPFNNDEVVDFTPEMASKKAILNFSLFKIVCLLIC